NNGWGGRTRTYGMLESKSSALPTWLHPKAMAHLGGLEPPTHGLEIRCSIQLSYRCIFFFMERVKGIEPSQPAWKAGALPLSYTRMVEETGFEPVKAKPTDLQSVPFSQTRALLQNNLA